MSHCELITDEGIRSVGVSPCSAEHLAVLELDNCPLITDAALDNLISCHSLQRIELYDCQLITRAGIRRLRVMLHICISLFLSFFKVSILTLPCRVICPMCGSTRTLLPSPRRHLWVDHASATAAVASFSEDKERGMRRMDKRKKTHQFLLLNIQKLLY